MVPASGRKGGEGAEGGAGGGVPGQLGLGVKGTGLVGALAVMSGPPL